MKPCSLSDAGWLQPPAIEKEKKTKNAQNIILKRKSIENVFEACSFWYSVIEEIEFAACKWKLLTIIKMNSIKDRIYKFPSISKKEKQKLVAVP